jgi:hypothetical protein
VSTPIEAALPASRSPAEARPVAARMPFSVREYRPEDEPQVLDVLARSLPRWAAWPDPAAVWRWKHQGNPFGRSCILVATTPDDRVLAVVAMMFWRLRDGRRVLLCERSTDMVTHPDYRRLGIMSSFTVPGQQRLVDAGVKLVFHTPNRNSVSFSLKWKRPVFEVRPVFGVRRPGRILAALLQPQGFDASAYRVEPEGVFRSTPLPLASLLERRAELEELLAQDALRHDGRLQTDRTWEYLRWRYATHPTIRYYALCSESHGRLEGCIVLRADRYGRLRRVVLQEVLLPRHDSRVIRDLRRQLDAQVDADVVQYYDSDRVSTRLLLGRTLPTRNAYNFTIGIYDQAMGSSPLDLSSWNLALGDLEEI